MEQAQFMNIAIVGHVDHGKSTVIGRLLADTKSLPDGKLEAVRANCERNSKPFEYAFLIDALKDEQAQGITIDSARVFFKTPKRHYIIIDTPGHIEFLKNMVTGAARAEAAFLVIDAKEGVQENSRRHGYLLSMLGIRQIAVLVNKMDLVDYKEDVFKNIIKEYSKFLSQVGLEDVIFVPVSGREGDMIQGRSDAMDWYKGPTALEVLDGFPKEAGLGDKPFRMPVQDVYKFTKFGDDRRVVAGTVLSGSLSQGDEVVFYPSGKKSHVKSLEAFNVPGTIMTDPGAAVGFTLTEQIYIKRGQVVALASEKAPQVASRLSVNLFWLGKKSMMLGQSYTMKIGTARVSAELEEIRRVVDASDLNYKKKVEEVQRHEVAECVLRLNMPVSFDAFGDGASLSRFVLIDDYCICGGGIIQKALHDKVDKAHQSAVNRNLHWVSGQISQQDRAERYQQKAGLVIVTGAKDGSRKDVARLLEQRLFLEGRYVYFLGIGSVIYGLDADILQGKKRYHDEHWRRLAEVSNIFLDAGMILVLTAVELTKKDLEIVRPLVDDEKIFTVWIGDEAKGDLHCDMTISEAVLPGQAADDIYALLEEEDFFKPDII